MKSYGDRNSIMQVEHEPGHEASGSALWCTMISHLGSEAWSAGCYGERGRVTYNLSYIFHLKASLRCALPSCPSDSTSAFFRGFAKGVSRTVSPRFFFSENETEKRKKTEKNGRKRKKRKKTEKTEKIGSDTTPATPFAKPRFLALNFSMKVGQFMVAPNFARLGWISSHEAVLAKTKSEQKHLRFLQSGEEELPPLSVQNWQGRANGRGGFGSQTAADPPATPGGPLKSRLWVLCLHLTKC